MISLVVHAVDEQRLATFYGDLLGLPVVETGERFVVLARGGTELSVVRVAAEVAGLLPLTDPPQVREDAPLKACFEVNDLERARALAGVGGGGLEDEEWEFRGRTRVDGWDPEGNVFQVAVRDR